MHMKKKRNFGAQVFLKMKEADIIVRDVSKWGVRIVFPSKKKGSDFLRVIHNYISLNAGIKPAYSMHNIDEVLRTLIQLITLSSWWGQRRSNRCKTASLRMKLSDLNDCKYFLTAKVIANRTRRGSHLLMWRRGRGQQLWTFLEHHSQAQEHENQEDISLLAVTLWDHDQGVENNLGEHSWNIKSSRVDW